MPPARPDDLAYGHLGEAKYDSRSETWHFGRIPGIRRRLQPISNFNTSLEPALQESQPEPRLAATRNRQIRQLIKYEPILAPAAFLLPTLAQVSEAVIDSTAACDSAISTLIAFGSAEDVSNRDSGSGTVEVVAVAGGSAGEAVRIVYLPKAQAESEGHEDTPFTHWAIDKKEQGFWVGRGSPVQQVCFSEDDGQPGGLLAVRCSTATTILRPLLRCRPVSPANLSRKKTFSKHFHPSRLDPNPIAELHINLTGHASHVDVAFNPWDQHQIAVLDANGWWSIWDIEESTKRRTTWTLRAGISGNFSAEEEDAVGGTTIQDSWGIILWIYSPTSIVIARRSAVVLHNTISGIQQMLGHDLRLAEASEWIFDVKRSPVDSTQLFVLTSSCIFWLRISADQALSKQEARAHILLARRHFRSQEDRSLQISLSATTEVIMVVLYSRTSELTTVFTFGLTPSLQLPQSISDPFILPLSNMQREEASGANEPQITSQKRILSTLCLRLLTDSYLSRARSEEPLDESFPSGMPLYQLFILYKDLGVSERLYVYLGDGENPLGRYLAQKIQLSSAETLKVTGRKSFVVPDAFMSDAEGSDSRNEVSNDEVVRNTRRRKSSTASKDAWVLDLKWLATAIEESRSTGNTRNSSAELFVKVIYNAMAALDDQTPGVHVLLDLFTGLPMDNLDNASSLLQSFVNGIDEGGGVPGIGSAGEEDSGQQHKVLLLSTPSISSAFQNKIDRDNNVLILSSYEALLNLWISSLESSVPGRTRVGLEKQVRKIAIELYLSLHMLHHGPNVSAAGEATASIGFNDEINLPFRRRHSAERLSRKNKERRRDSSPLGPPAPDVAQPRQAMLPTPQPTPSQTSQRPASASAKSGETPYERLKTLVPLKPQPALSNTLLRLVDQWEIGLDPYEYDWDNTQQYLSSQSDADGPDAESARRRRQRREKRMKRYHQESVGASSQPDSTNYFSSQPQIHVNLPSSSQVAESKAHASSQLTVPVVQGSSQTTAPMVVGSQTERDVLRGRSTRVKKFTLLGKRKPGFG